MTRLGLCCTFQDQPIKFITTTATAIGKMKRPDALKKLSRLCMENANALLKALEFCAGNGIGCFRVISHILSIKTHPTCGYTVSDLPESDEIIRPRLFCRVGDGLLNGFLHPHRANRKHFEGRWIPNNGGILQALD